MNSFIKKYQVDERNKIYVEIVYACLNPNGDTVTCESHSSFDTQSKLFENYRDK